MCKGKVTSFIGKSGVGKSSILNRIDGSFLQKVGDISDYSSKGKHTTKQARLFPLEFGGYISLIHQVYKEFGLWRMKAEELKEHFPEIHALSDQCKYSNCMHINEPQCAVQEAYDNDDIPEFRYINYLKIYESLKELDSIYFKKD